jgi:hypothetical protein
MADAPPITSFPLPPVVYHYCGQATALAMLESGCVWLNNQRGMNDPQDTAWAIPHIQMHLNRRVDTKNLDAPEAVRVREFWNAFSINTPDVYVSSFSQSGDILSQWRAYADDGAGFALGFDPLAFGVHQMQVPQLSAEADRTVGMTKVVYDDSKLEDIFSPFFDALVAGQVPVDGAVIIIRGIMMLFKNPAYREESEWRIIYSPTVAESANNEIQVFGKYQEMFFRQTKYGIFPYFKLPFKIPAIKEIVLGPKNRTPLELVKLWLLKHGHVGAEVKKSRASYR